MDGAGIDKCFNFHRLLLGKSGVPETEFGRNKAHESHHSLALSGRIGASNRQSVVLKIPRRWQYQQIIHPGVLTSVRHVERLSHQIFLYLFVKISVDSWNFVFLFSELRESYVSKYFAAG
jgi:hypothetical protein